MCGVGAPARLYHLTKTISSSAAASPGASRAASAGDVMVVLLPICAFT